MPCHSAPILWPVPGGSLFRESGAFRGDHRRTHNAAVIAECSLHDLDLLARVRERLLAGPLLSLLEEEIDRINHSATEHNSLRVHEIHGVCQTVTEVLAGL